MRTLSYTLLFGTLAIGAGLLLQKMLTALISGHGMDSVFFALPFG
jgi:hypothetical protein